ncbi:uncharacterized protein N7496_005441 [Penicillium cataractarum]|uniref:Uncharacterized protein n=1 Tax=Penicillium cataractarum TaxID=2100454 RepID=A0A9W9SH43_9EURO|nr:uncharacterized protein N7496_005441 [Penicillium cataractarum]KAJ5378032.1 hypothetical protein N7496_005441 [Penicillium cataractarum]
MSDSHYRVESFGNENLSHLFDNSLFALMISSDFGPYSPNNKALKSFFDYIQAGRELCDATASRETPIKQRAALKVLRCLHTNLEREIDWFGS